MSINKLTDKSGNDVEIAPVKFLDSDGSEVNISTLKRGPISYTTYNPSTKGTLLCLGELDLGSSGRAWGKLTVSVMRNATVASIQEVTIDVYIDSNKSTDTTAVAPIVTSIVHSNPSAGSFGTGFGTVYYMLKDASTSSTLYVFYMDVTSNGSTAMRMGLNANAIVAFDASDFGNGSSTTEGFTACQMFYDTFVAEGGAGSASIPVYVNSNGQMQACTDDFVHDGDVTSTYSATGTQPVNGTAVASAISTQVSEYSNKGLEATTDTLFAVTTTDQLNVALLVYSGRASTDANATYAILTFRVKADWSAVYSKATYLGDSRVGRCYYLADTSTKTLTIGVTGVNYSNGLRVKVLECTHGYSRTAITDYTVLPGTTFSTSGATVVPSVATTWQNYNAGVGSASIPTYVAANGQVTQCTDDFVHDGEDITGNAATATHLKNPQIVETSYKAAETANYWVNFADITQSTVNYHSGGNLFTVMPKALTAITFSFRLPHADSSTPAEFLYTSLQALSNYKVGYTLDTTSGYVYHFWIKVPQKGRVTYNCMQEYAGNVSGTLSDGTLDETSTEPTDIVYASLGGVVNKADTATNYASSGGIATALAAKATNSDVVHIADTEIVTGTKTFSSNVSVSKSSWPMFITKSTSNNMWTKWSTDNNGRVRIIEADNSGSSAVETAVVKYNTTDSVYEFKGNADTATQAGSSSVCDQLPTVSVGSDSTPVYWSSAGSFAKCTSVNADTVDGYHVSVGSTIGTGDDTLYFLK